MPSPIDAILEIPGNRVAIKYLVAACKSDRGVTPVYTLQESPYYSFPRLTDFRKEHKGLGDIMFLDFVEESYTGKTPPPELLAAHRALLMFSRGAVICADPDDTVEAAVAETGIRFHVVGDPRPASLAVESHSRILLRCLGSASRRTVLQPPEWIFGDGMLSRRLFLESAAINSLLFVGVRSWSEGISELLRSVPPQAEIVHYQLAVGGDEVESARLRGVNMRIIRLSDWSQVGPLLAYLESQVAPPPPKLANPKPPQDLVERCRQGEMFLLTGSGLSARANLPTWRAVVSELIAVAESSGAMTPESAGAQRAAMSAGDVNAVADNLSSAFSSNRAPLVSYLQSHSGRGVTLPPIFEVMKRIRVAAILSTNYDELLDGAFAGTGVGTEILVPSEGEKLHSLLSQRAPFLLKLYGSLQKPDSMVFAPAEWQAMISADRDFGKFMEAVLYSRTLLMVGASLEGITDFLRGFPIPTGISRKHYALVAVTGEAWRAKAESLTRRYNIEVLPYIADETHSAVDEFLEALARQAPAEEKAASVESVSRLRRMVLKNIGPFEDFELDFEGNWKILLGDNGVGKSSVLRALALAIVGDAGSESAGRLVRAGQKHGSVLVMTDKNPSGYLTEIFGTVTGGKATVESRSGRLMEGENWVALGFPPLRTGTGKNSPGPQSGGADRPLADDVLPLLSGAVDPRMDQLKQWLVNYELASAKKGAKSVEARALAKFYEIVGRLTGELQLKGAGVDPEYRVMVRVNNDEPIPIDVLSQGLTSLLSWVGVLVQRMYEIRGAKETDPTQLHGVVLMDEIDAHMHPEWQRTLVKTLSEIFPQVQFVTSTHSPMIVAGMGAEQVVRVVRDERGKVVTAAMDEDATLGRYDQILMGDGFRLATTLSAWTMETVEQYTKLLGKSSRSEAEELEFQKLEAMVERQIPPDSDGAMLLEAVTDLLPEKDKWDERHRRVLLLAGRLS